jgi:hypothetical protein
MPSEREAIRRWLRDIEHHIGMAKGFVAGIGYDSFRDDNLRLYAVTRCLEILPEASRRRVWCTLTISLPPLRSVVEAELVALGAA